MIFSCEKTNQYFIIKELGIIFLESPIYPKYQLDIIINLLYNNNEH